MGVLANARPCVSGRVPEAFKMARLAMGIALRVFRGLTFDMNGERRRAG